MHHVKVLTKRFQLNDHTKGFHPQTQKLQHLLFPLPPIRSRSEGVTRMYFKVNIFNQVGCQSSQDVVKT